MPQDQQLSDNNFDSHNRPPQSHSGSDDNVQIEPGDNVKGNKINTGGGGYVVGDVKNSGGITQVGSHNTVINNAAPHRRACPTAPNLSASVKFAGRDDELADLKQLLKAGGAVAITAVQGLGGIGKTSLAHKLAQELFEDTSQDRAFRAVLWADITRSFEPVTAIQNWGKLAEPECQPRVGETVPEFATRVKGLLENLINEECEECGPNRVLVVLDDVWEKSRASADTLLLARPANSSVVITTRFSSLADQLATYCCRLDRFKPDEAVKVLQGYLPKLSPELAARLAKALGGHALAMRLAVGRVEKLRLTQFDALKKLVVQYETDLSASFTNLVPVGEEARDVGLEKSLALNYQELDEEYQSYFRATGAFAPDLTFNLDMLAKLWQVEDERAGEIAEQLLQLELLDKVEPDELNSDDEDGEVWFSQHPVLNAYARALLRRENEEATTCDHYDDLITNLTQAFIKLPLEEWWKLDPYLPHIYALGERLAEQVLEQNRQDLPLLQRMKRFATCSSRYIYHRMEVVMLETVRAVGWLEGGLKASQYLADHDNQARFFNDLGTVCAALGDNVQALDYYQQALPLHRQAGNKGGEAAVLSNIGAVYRTTGDQQQALEHYQQGLMLMQQVDDKRGEAAILNNIGLTYNNLDDNQQALNYFQQALMLRRQVSDKRGEATTLSNIGLAYNNLGDNEQALEYYQRALPLRRQVGDKRGEANTLTSIGYVYRDISDPQQALDYYQQALPLNRQVGDKSGEAFTLHNMAAVLWETARHQEAVELEAQALELFRYVQSPYAEPTANTLAQMRSILAQA